MTSITDSYLRELLDKFWRRICKYFLILYKNCIGKPNQISQRQRIVKTFIVQLIDKIFPIDTEEFFREFDICIKELIKQKSSTSV